MKNLSRRLPLSATCAALVLLLVATGPAVAASGIHFQRESYQEFLRQLGHGEVHAVVLHAKAHVAHISLADGRHMTAVYPAGEQAQIAKEALARGVSATVSVTTHKAAPVHHKLRYIAGGVLIVVILVVLVVLLIGRRRALVDGEASPPPAPSG
jgi:hypothetical protein